MSSHLSAEAKGGGDCLETTLRDSNPTGLLRSIRLALALAMSCLDGFHSRSKRFPDYTTNVAALLVIWASLMRFFPYSSRDQKNDRLR